MFFGALILGLSHVAACVGGAVLSEYIRKDRLVPAVKRRPYVALMPKPGPEALENIEAAREAGPPVDMPYGPAGNLSEEEIRNARRAMEAGTGEGFTF